MLTTIKMPKLGETMEEGTILSWYKAEGERVEQGEPLFEVQTDKVSMEYESPVAGVLKRIVAKVGQTVQVQQIVAYLGDEGDEAPPLEDVKVERKPAMEEREAAVSVDIPPLVPNSPCVTDKSAERPFISPRARLIAQKMGVDLDPLVGSGPSGRVRASDVETAARDMDIRSGQSAPMRGMRKVIAERMTVSFRDTPHFYLGVDVDMTASAELRRMLQPAWEDKYGLRLSYNDLVVHAVALALAESPVMNSRVDGKTIVHLDQVNVGVAVSVEGGLLVPVLRKADRLSLRETAQAIREMVQKARDGKLQPGEYNGGNFTVSNLGMYGITEFSAIINPPESGILAVGAIGARVVAIDGRPEVRTTCRLTLSVDHRIVDGVQAAEFLAKVKSYLEQPGNMLG